MTVCVSIPDMMLLSTEWVKEEQWDSLGLGACSTCSCQCCPRHPSSALWAAPPAVAAAAEGLPQCCSALSPLVSQKFTKQQNAKVFPEKG